MKKILLLGSGELGKELTISLQRFGCYIIACDKYKNAPAMQVSQEYEVFDMLNSNNLKQVINKHKPDFIVPEVEAIETNVLIDAEQNGYNVIPSAKAVTSYPSTSLAKSCEYVAMFCLYRFCPCLCGAPIA